MKKLCLLLLVVLIAILLIGCNTNSVHQEMEQNSNPVKTPIPEKAIVSKTDYEQIDQIVGIEVNDMVETEKTQYEQDSNVKVEKEQVDVDISNQAIIEAQKENVITDTQYMNKQLISTGSTSFNPNNKQRSNNIRLAAEHINGLVLYPGEEFSFNRVVGKRTAERGFLPADIFVGQSTAKGYGGGVCQTSSTVCIAVRGTDMKILEQNPHSQRVTYTTIENEAMINYGTSDFRFVNTYDFPVVLELSFEGTDERETIRCEIFALK